MSIQWFPGHMHKTRQTLKALMPECDVVIELLDARMPMSSSNPLLDELRREVTGKGEQGRPGDVPCVTLLTKADLADPEVTHQGREVFRTSRGVRTKAVNLTDPKSVRPLAGLIRRHALRRPQPGRPVRAVVVGIPNVGKSTFVNALRGRKVAKVGDEPAVTKGRQPVDLKNGIVLIDTPGILWPKVEDPLVAQRLALSGAIRDTAYDETQSADFAIRYLVEYYPEALPTRYGVDRDETDVDRLLAAIGRRLGCLAPGGEPDPQRTSQRLLKDLRSGRLGRISFEKP
ncbi:MAG: ribosome biogenesis GTPase YlqF [Phycisphaeraceae bacterium]